MRHSSPPQIVLPDRMPDRSIPTEKLEDAAVLTAANAMASNEPARLRALIESYALRRVVAATFR